VTRHHTRCTALAIAVLAMSSGAAGCRSGSPAEEKEPEADVAVGLGKVVRTSLHSYVTAYGTVDAQPATSGHPAASARIGSAVAGLLAQSAAVEGERVEKGAVLFVLDTRVADAQVEKARQAVEFAQVGFDRQTQLLAADGTSKKLYQEAQQQLQAAKYDLANANAQRALLTVTAPIAGTVTHVLKKLGDVVDASSPLAEIVDLDRLVVEAHIRTSDVTSLHPGQGADISPGRPESAQATAHQAPVAIATISFIGADVDSANDTVTVRAALPAHPSLRLGQFVTLRVSTGERRDRLAVPEDSIITSVGSSDAFVAVVKNNIADQVPVTIGIRDNGLVEVEGKNISEGTVIVTTGAYSLPAHTKVHQIAK
jgi:membrane fusion protein (multidrug efflux system)